MKRERVVVGSDYVKVTVLRFTSTKKTGRLEIEKLPQKSEKIGTNSVSTLNFAFKKLNTKHLLSNRSWRDRGSRI